MEIAFLHVLIPKGLTPDQSEIERTIKENTSFKEIRPFEEYDSKKGNFVVWRFNHLDTIPDEMARKLNSDDFILYLWHCVKCGSLARRSMHPKKQNQDGYFGCSCSGGAVGSLALG